MATNGNGNGRRAIQLERAEVLELQLMDERLQRLRMQMQMIQNQAQQLHIEKEKVEHQKSDLVRRLSSKYETDISRFAVDTETNIASGMAVQEG